MDYFLAFLVGGAICALGQVLLDTSKFSPPHMLVAFVVAGAILSGLGIYDKLVDFAGAGASSCVRVWPFDNPRFFDGG